MNSEKIKPCPCCGGVAVHEPERDTPFRMLVRCTKCGLSTWPATNSKEILVWNRRPQQGVVSRFAWSKTYEVGMVIAPKEWIGKRVRVSLAEGQA